MPTCQELELPLQSSSISRCSGFHAKDSSTLVSRLCFRYPPHHQALTTCANIAQPTSRTFPPIPPSLNFLLPNLPALRPHQPLHVLGTPTGISKLLIMPFRAKVRRVLGRPSVSEEGADLTQTTSKASKKEKKPKAPNNVYKPGEVMPKPKYRGPVNKEHQEKLRAFSFAGAFGRRNSEQSQYSPMGSRLPSRRNSVLGKFSFGSKSRQQSYVDAPVKESTEGDDDVKNGKIIAWRAEVRVVPDIPQWVFQDSRRGTTLGSSERQTKRP